MEATIIEVQPCYNETDRKHPRGFIGMEIANQLIKRGWHEETVNVSYVRDEHFWVSPKGEQVGSLEFAYRREFGRGL